MSRLATALALVVLLAVAARAQTFCEKYAAALNVSQPELIGDVITDVFGNVTADQVILPWFNGSNGVKGRAFVGPNASASISTLANKLINFFGLALGCNDSAFFNSGMYSASTTGISSNMTAFHATFQVAVSKLPYELFNIHILKVMHDYGVAAADLYSVSQVLDTFRGPGLVGGSSNYTSTICQASDCYSAPFTVYMYDNYFLPSYYAVPTKGTVLFSNVGQNPHEPAQSSGVGSCTTQSGGWASSSVTNGNSYTTPSLANNGNVYFECEFHCNSGMNGSLLVTTLNTPGGTTGTTGSGNSGTTGNSGNTGSATTLFVAVAAMLAAFFAMLF
jgi:plastocyanin